MNRTKPITGELLKLKEMVESYAVDYGLSFYPVIFEMCNYDTVCILAAQGGFPSRYPHWRFGMEFDQLSKGNTYGFQKIYELVINTDPCYAYLLNSNRYVDQKLVMAHVYGHADFFKNNAWFKPTNKKMMDVMANHGTKVRRYMEKYGQNKVEDFIDKVLSLENLVDPSILFETSEAKRRREELNQKAIQEKEMEANALGSSALDSFLRSKNRSARKNLVDQPQQEKPIELDGDYKGTRDIMNFLINYAPIEEWEADILSILRDEAYYFLPQRMTKIMNEGWASYWHSKILTEKALNSSEIIDFADVHSGVMAMSRQNINPYKIGIELFRDIEHRWDTGKFGKEYNDCPSMYEKEHWDTGLMKGKEKIFEVRSTHNDITFIDDFFTPEFCERQQLFTYKYNPRTGRNEIESRDFHQIKSQLLTALTNFGSPVIEVDSNNYNNRGELLLKHVHHGVDLDMNMAAETMKNIFYLWKRPVNIRTIEDEKETVYCYNGKQLEKIKVGQKLKS